MKLIRSFVVVAAAVLAVVGAALPAQAHDGHWIYVTGGRAMFSGSWLDVCDTAVDGNRVRAHLRSNTGNIYYSGWAPSRSCNREGHPTSITSYRVCAENHGCSAWHNRY